MPTSATLTGVVTPNGLATNYVFVYGTNRYDSHTATASAGDSTAPAPARTTNVDGSPAGGDPVRPAGAWQPR